MKVLLKEKKVASKPDLIKFVHKALGKILAGIQISKFLAQETEHQ